LYVTPTVEAKAVFHEYYLNTAGCVIVIYVPVFKTFRMLMFFLRTLLFKAVTGRKIEINVQEENSEYFKWEMWALEM
jgi:hypothetical protein